MDQEEFNERVSRLQDVGKIIEKLPAEIRNESFELLKPYILRQATASGPNKITGDVVASGGGDGADLFSKFSDGRQSDNVRLIAAYLFQEYGAEPFSVEEVKTEAANAGITIPDRVDMTLANAQEKGKSLFVRAGLGKFRPTVHGEAHLKSKYGVTKGKKKRSVDDK